MQQKEKVPVPMALVANGLVMATNIQKNPELTVFKPEHYVDEPFVRNFVVSAVDIFLQVQKEYKSFYPDPVPQRIVTSLSRMYRSLLLELCQNLKDSGDMAKADLYTNLDFIWNFCEVMFLSSHPDFPILPYLADWIKINFDQTGDVLPDILNELPDLSPTSMDRLWSLIYSHVFHGATLEASRLLPYVKAGGNSTSAVLNRNIDLMTEMLVKRPDFDPNGGSVTEFQAMFTAWQEECYHRLDKTAFHGHEQLSFICKILCGDSEAFAEAVSKCSMTWYEYLVLQLNYKYPTIRPGMLRGYAKKTLDELEINVEQLTTRDMILLQAMDFHIANLLKEIQSVWDNPWFALHLADLIFACGRVSSGEERVDYSVVAPLRNHFILEYGASVMEHPTMWQMGVHYLEALPENQGRTVIRDTIQRKKPSSEIEAYKLLRICEKFSFGREITSICRQMALEKKRYGQIQNALLWAIKAGDGPLTTSIVDSILFEGDCRIEESLLDSLQNVIPCADRLLFLQSFCDFRRYMSRKDYKYALMKLCELIKDELIPKRIAPKVLLSVEELVESGEPFEAYQISTLMQFVHTQVPRESIPDEQFRNLNALLLRMRTQNIFTVFKEKRKNIAATANYY